MTVHPSSLPPPRDRVVGQMPPGWKPTPPTPADRAAQLRKLAADDRERADGHMRAGRTKVAKRLLRQADAYETRAAKFDQVPTRADRP